MTHHMRALGAMATSRNHALPGVTRVHKPVARLFKAGQPLFYQGDDAQFILEVQSGVLRQTRSLENGERQVLAFHFPGDFVGFSEDGLHHAGCTAITGGRALIHRAEVLDRPHLDPDLHDRLLGAALQEIGLMRDHFVMLGRKTACAKVEAFLGYMIERVGVLQNGQQTVDIPMSRYDIADFLGIAVETVSRSFTQLRDAGIIAMDDAHRLTVLCPAAFATTH